MVKNLPAMQQTWIWSLGQEWQPTPVFLPGEFHGQRSLEGYSLWGLKKSDWVEVLTFYGSESCSVVSDSLRPHGCPWNSPGQNTGVGSRSLLQGIFPTLGLNPGLVHCSRIPYQMSHKGSPRILEWVAYPFSSGSSRPRNRTGVSCITGGFFTNWAIRKLLGKYPLLYFLTNINNITTATNTPIWEVYRETLSTLKGESQRGLRKKFRESIFVGLGCYIKNTIYRMA